jgi:hypothetical protein
VADCFLFHCFKSHRHRQYVASTAPLQPRLKSHPGTQTIVAIFNITAPALDISYAAVILARNVYAHRITFRPGPYTLGKWQKPLNLITCAWVFFISVVLLFPTVRPVTAVNMNYAVAVGGFIALFSLGWWWAGARNTYTGPRTQELLHVVPNSESREEEE